ncbi:MAG TPA: hypothetical protein DD644_05035 [Halomonas sp.]|nr:hypothetical protein [Halomonas sp.]
MVNSHSSWVVLSDGGLPTEDIYFLESAAPALQSQGATVERFVASRSFGAAWRYGRSFLRQYAGANVLLCRSLPPSWLRWLERNRHAFGYIGYLIDDDIEAAANDSTLPQTYRKRMARIAKLQPRLLALCDEVIACSGALAERFQPYHYRVVVLTPPMIAALPPLAHFASLPSSNTPWKIGFYGTRAHLNDLQHIAPALTAIQQTRTDTQLEIMLGKHTPSALAALPRTAVPDPLPWSAFRTYQASNLLHIGLAPLLNTPFNQGKSFIKFFDITAMGGVGVYANRYPYTEIVSHGHNGLLVEDSPKAWQAAIEQLLNDPAATAKMAQQAARDAVSVGNPQFAVKFWQARANQLNVNEGASRMDAIVKAFFDETPDANISKERVAFGTSGHRGRASERTFNAAHIFAITQAVVDYRSEAGYQGPMFLGVDTHALSKPAWECALRVLAANKVPVLIEKDAGITATPLVSRAILQHNHAQKQHFCDQAALADGLIITPSHNPPEDGGIKYNPAHGGPADTDATSWIELRANAYLLRQLNDITLVPLEQALAHAQEYDFTAHYVAQLVSVVDMAAIQNANLTLGVDPMGGTALPVWQAVAEHFGLNLEVVNTSVDATFSFMPPDHDGKIRMDCSSSAAMANLLTIKDRFDIAFGNDPDADRHGIVDANGLMNPNHFLAVCVDYLIGHRPEWAETLNIGKTLVSSSMIDRVVASHQRTLYEVPVGFKWFVEGLHDGWLAFGGEESAGASLLTRDGKAWSTDKDGIALCLLAAEIMAVTGKTPSEYYRSLTERFGEPFYKRVDTACTAEEKAAFKQLSAESVTETTLAGDPITAVLVNAPGNGAAIGGLKVTTDNGWFAARPSGTESLYKVYAESFKGPQHLDELIDSATTLLSGVLKG